MELLLTVEQAALRLQLAPFTVRDQLKRGKLRGIKRGRVWRIPESALLESSPENLTRHSSAAVSTSGRKASFARALKLVAQLEHELKDSPRRVYGVDDAATEIRSLREERTP